MDFRFVANEVRLSLGAGGWFWKEESGGPAVPFTLRGLVCPHVGDRFGPPAEWNYLSTTQIRTVERRPLEAHVFLFSHAEWQERFQPRELFEGKPFLLANQAEAAKSHAVVHYSPPDKDPEWYDDRRNAVVQIELRLNDRSVESWNAFGHRWLGRSVIPAVRVLVDNVGFAHTDEIAEKIGVPSWRYFLDGNGYGIPHQGYWISVQTSEDEEW